MPFLVHRKFIDLLTFESYDIKSSARDAQLAAGKIVALQHHAFNFYIANGELVGRAERKV